MESIRSMQEVALPGIIEPTQAAFGPLLLKNKAAIEAIPKKSFKYGTTDRHQLDIYYPTATQGSDKAPVLFFCYGGGFATGDRNLPGKYESVVYSNLGAYFASKGFITVIPDYRLVPNVKFPGGSVDIRDAVLWVVERERTWRIAECPEPDVDNVILSGHSAGAIHLGILMFYPPVLESMPYLRSHIKAVVLSGPVYHYQQPAIPPPILAHYFGEGEELAQKTIMHLFKTAPENLLKGLPQIIMVESERDMDAMKISGADFRPVLAQRMKEVGGGRGGWMTAPWIEAKGHNHLSLNWALMSGEGDEWAEQLVAELRKL